MINSDIKATGAVRVLIYENDRLIDTIQENNLVVNLGKTNIAKLLGGDTEGHAITQIGVGTNGADAALGDSTLANMFKKAVGGATYPDAQSVQFNFDILNSEGNGITIRELGLLNAANVLCARKVRAGEIVKTSAIRLVGSWTITVN
ncbi:hypothetical protein [Chitinophaga sp. CF418]|uniref:hypothetical protein n=1 Tax=Chitinophaga sp. CF418 TaxID=1855287 RepID=UPI000912BB4F|nr:hypothetical protein [Chitinophaga sp. CF418]SHN42220.1 hypothetical protein SAMN05216311_114138 [Chitinophaga sp. CF418]